MTPGRLSGKIAVVTGAAQGIGRAIVESFAAEGATVIAADLNVTKLLELSKRSSIEIHALDVTDQMEVQSAAHRYQETNVLINCAGYVATGSILTASRADLDLSYQINVGSIFSMTQAFLPAMLERQSGSIINIASVVSTVKAAGDRCVYATSKGAVIALTKSIALDFIKKGIRCNSISPGTVHTPSLDERMSAAYSGDGDRRFRFIVTGLARSEVLGVDDNSVGHVG